MTNIALEVDFSLKYGTANHISAVKLDAAGKTVDDFDTYVKQAKFSPSDYGDTEDAAKKFVIAPPLGEAIESFVDWVGDDQARIITWNDYTFDDLDREARGAGVECPPSSLGTHLALESVFSLLMGYRDRPVKMYTALAWCGGEENKTSNWVLGGAYDVASLFASLVEDCRRVYGEAQRTLWSRSAARVDLCRASISEEYLNIIYAHIRLGEYTEAARLLEVLEAYPAD